MFSLSAQSVWKIWMPLFLNVMWAVCMCTCVCVCVCVCVQNKYFVTILWCFCVATQHTLSDWVNEVCTVVNFKMSLLCWLLFRFSLKSTRESPLQVYTESPYHTHFLLRGFIASYSRSFLKNFMSKRNVKRRRVKVCYNTHIFIMFQMLKTSVW